MSYLQGMTNNTLLQFRVEGSTDKLIERVLFIHRAEKIIITIDIFDTTALPTVRDLGAVQIALDTGDAHILSIDPYAELVQLAEELIPKRHRHIRDKRWKLIKRLIEDANGQPNIDIFLHNKRRKLILELLELLARELEEKKKEKRDEEELEDGKKKDESLTTEMTIYKLLRLFWQRGQILNALLPDFYRCGGKGKERQLRKNDKSDRRTGRKNKKAEPENPADSTAAKKSPYKLGNTPAATKAKNEPVGIPLDDKIKGWIVRAGRDYCQELGWSIPRAYDQFNLDHYTVGYKNDLDGLLVPLIAPPSERPTQRQFEYWYQKDRNSDLIKALKAEVGEAKFNLLHRPILGDSTLMTPGPGFLFQIDATLADNYLVSYFDRRRIVGRPVLYVVIDVFSRLIVGFYVGFEGPSWIGAMMALDNTASDKVEFCREHGITIPFSRWPNKYLCRRLIGDRGELEGYNADNPVAGLNIAISNTAPYRADWKAIVERYFRLINTMFTKWIPGAVYSLDDRKGDDYRLDACLDIFQFRQLLIRLFLYYNLAHELKYYNRSEFMIHDQLDLCPINLWEWGIHNRTGHLRTIDRDTVRMHLLPKDKVSVTQQGLFFDGRRYDCKLAHEDQWYVRAGLRGSFDKPIVYDPRKMDQIYILPERGHPLETCYLHETEAAYLGRDWHEYRDMNQIRLQQAPDKQADRDQAKAEFLAYVENVVEPAREEAQRLREGMSKSQQTRDIRANHALEKQALREKEAWDLSPQNAKQDRAQSTTQSGYVPQPQYTEMMDELDEELLKDE